MSLTDSTYGNILMILREIAFEKICDELLSKLLSAMKIYNDLFDNSTPNLNHMKQSLEIAKSLGVDTQRMERSDENRLCFEAAFVLVLANRPEGQAVQYQCMNRLLREYPEFVDTEEIEQTKLLHFRNFMSVALMVTPANHNRSHLLNLITRITEGRCVKYVTGSGAMRSTRRRVLIYEREGKIVPSIRPPRKDSKPPRKPPRRKRKREVPPGCSSSLVTNAFNEHSLRLIDPLSPATIDTEGLPMFIQIPSKTTPVSGMKVPTYQTIASQDMELENEFKEFLNVVWDVGVHSSCFGWTGTFVQSLSIGNVEQIENKNRSKRAYMKVLELYYHINDGSLLKKSESHIGSPTDEYQQDCLNHLIELFNKTKSELKKLHHEHVMIMGLFFCIKRCIKRGLFQYYGEVAMRPGSDICMDYTQAVEVYFTMLFRLSGYSPDSKSTPVMLIALENSYARVMEIYIRLRNGVSSGLLHLHQSSWPIVRESLYTEFYLMRQYAFKMKRRGNADPVNVQSKVQKADNGENETNGSSCCSSP